MVEKYTIKTFEEPICIQVVINIPFDQEIIFKGSSNENLNVYFKRVFNDFDKGEVTLLFPMPCSPKNLRLIIKGDSFKVKQVKAVPLQTKPLIFNSEDDLEYYKFAIKFACKFQRLPLGVYSSPSGKFKIKYTQKIIGEDGIISNSPAATYMDSGVIEVAKSNVHNMTTDMMVMILLHERMHFKLDTFDEELCDEYAAHEYNAMGFPSNEGLSAFLNVFKPVSPEHEAALIRRTDKLYAILNSVTPHIS